MRNGRVLRRPAALLAAAIMMMIMMIATATAAGAVDSVEIPREIASVNATLAEGVDYTSTAQNAVFKFQDWGEYRVIDFPGERCFAGYLDTPESKDDILFEKSRGADLLSGEQIYQVLIDDDLEQTLASGNSLKLKEGYELSVKSIDIEGKKVYLELSKDGTVVDSRVISPSADNAGMADRTYLYRKDIGNGTKIVIVAAHFKNALRGPDGNVVVIDGLWQISDAQKKLSSGASFENMSLNEFNIAPIMMRYESNNATHLSYSEEIRTPGTDGQAGTQPSMAGAASEPAAEPVAAEETKTAEAPSSAALPAEETLPAAEAPFAEETKAVEVPRTEALRANETAPAEEKPSAEAAPAAELPAETVAKALDGSPTTGMDYVVQNLPNGTIVMAVPAEMTVGETKQFLIAISRTANMSWSGSESFTRELDARAEMTPEEISSDVLRVYEYMKVLLYSDDPDDFEIVEQFDEDRRYVPRGEFAVWKWMVTPKESGEKAIRMRAVVSIENNPPYEFDVYNKTYAIKSDASYSIQKFIDDYKIIGAVITALIGLLVWFAKRKIGGGKGE